MEVEVSPEPSVVQREEAETFLRLASSHLLIQRSKQLIAASREMIQLSKDQLDRPPFKCEKI